MNTQLPTESNTAVKVRVTPKIYEGKDEKKNSRFKEAFKYFGLFVKILFIWGGDRGIKYAEAKVQKETNEAERIASESIKNYEESLKIASEKKVEDATAKKIEQENVSMFLENLIKVSNMQAPYKDLALQVLLMNLPEGEIRQQGAIVAKEFEYLRLTKNCDLTFDNKKDEQSDQS